MMSKPTLSYELSAKNIIKEGWLFKQSRYLKEWRKQAPLAKLRRWFVLTQQHLISFKEYKTYSKPTEVIEVKGCKTVKSVQDQIHKSFAFKLDTGTRAFFLQAESYNDKEAWIGALGKTMVRPTVMRSYSQEQQYEEY